MVIAAIGRMTKINSSVIQLLLEKGLLAKAFGCTIKIVLIGCNVRDAGIPTATVETVVSAWNSYTHVRGSRKCLVVRVVT